MDEAVRQAIRGGITMLQYREKLMSEVEYLKRGRELRILTRLAKIPLILNDRVEYVSELDADGVHLGQSDMSIRMARKILGEHVIIGATAHNVLEACRAEEEGATYLGVGAAFGSKTKRDAKKIALEEYQAITSKVHIPVCAIGGINPSNIYNLAGSGISGVAVISGIFGQIDICGMTRRLLVGSNAIVKEKKYEKY